MKASEELALARVKESIDVIADRLSFHLLARSSRHPEQTTHESIVEFLGVYLMERESLQHIVNLANAHRSFIKQGYIELTKRTELMVMYYSRPEDV